MAERRVPGGFPPYGSDDPTPQQEAQPAFDGVAGLPDDLRRHMFLKTGQTFWLRQPSVPHSAPADRSLPLLDAMVRAGFGDLVLPQIAEAYSKGPQRANPPGPLVASPGPYSANYSGGSGWPDGHPAPSGSSAHYDSRRAAGAFSGFPVAELRPPIAIPYANAPDYPSVPNQSPGWSSRNPAKNRVDDLGGGTGPDEYGNRSEVEHTGFTAQVRRAMDKDFMSRLRERSQSEPPIYDPFKGLGHLLDETGTDVDYDFDRIDTSSVNPGHFPQVQQKMNAGSGIYEIDDVIPFPTKNFSSKAYVGRIGLRLKGKLRVDGGRADFDGNLSALPDHYDFNKSEGRSFWGDVSTAIGRGIQSTFGGKEYDINIVGDRPIRDKVR